MSLTWIIIVSVIYVIGSTIAAGVSTVKLDADPLDDGEDFIKVGFISLVWPLVAALVLIFSPVLIGSWVAENREKIHLFKGWKIR